MPEGAEPLIVCTFHIIECDVQTDIRFIKKNPTRCNNVSKFYYSIFIWSSTCLGQHTAHHQEPKTALAASGFSYVEGCLYVQLVDVVWHTVPDNVHQLHVQTTFHVGKTRGCQYSFKILMMGGVSLVTCWASYKYGIIKFCYIVASCWIFIYELLSVVRGKIRTVRQDRFSCSQKKLLRKYLHWLQETLYNWRNSLQIEELINCALGKNFGLILPLGY